MSNVIFNEAFGDTLRAKWSGAKSAVGSVFKKGMRGDFSMAASQYNAQFVLKRFELFQKNTLEYLKAIKKYDVENETGIQSLFAPKAAPQPKTAPTYTPDQIEKLFDKLINSNSPFSETLNNLIGKNSASQFIKIYQSIYSGKNFDNLSKAFRKNPDLKKKIADRMATELTNNKVPMKKSALSESFLIFEAGEIHEYSKKIEKEIESFILDMAKHFKISGKGMNILAQLATLAEKNNLTELRAVLRKFSENIEKIKQLKLNIDVEKASTEKTVPVQNISGQTSTGASAAPVNKQGPKYQLTQLLRQSANLTPQDREKRVEFDGKKFKVTPQLMWVELDDNNNFIETPTAVKQANLTAELRRKEEEEKQEKEKELASRTKTSTAPTVAPTSTPTPSVSITSTNPTPSVTSESFNNLKYKDFFVN